MELDQQKPESYLGYSAYFGLIYRQASRSFALFENAFKSISEFRQSLANRHKHHFGHLGNIGSDQPSLSLVWRH
jgi:hypothetical protein